MRILQLTQFYPPILGGEERHVKSLSDELAARGHEVAVATLQNTNLPEYEVDEGVRIYRMRSTTQRLKMLYKDTERRHTPPAPDPETVLALRAVLHKERPDVVHAHNWLVYSFLPLKAAWRIPLVVTLHDYSLSCATKRLTCKGDPCTPPGWLEGLRRSTAHYGTAKGIATHLGNTLMAAVERAAVDMFLAVSQATAEGNGLRPGKDRYQVIPNFVPDSFGTQAPVHHPLVEQLPAGGYLLFVGDLTREKGVHVLLKAYERLEAAPPLVLIGRRHPETPGRLPDNVTMLHSWPHEAIMAAWARSSIAIVPSTWSEPFGIVALEAMASGRPLVASRTGGLKDVVVDGETGLLVPPGDGQRLAEALQTLISQPALRQRMGAAGQALVQQYKASVVVPQIEQVYGDLLCQKGQEKRNIPVKKAVKGKLRGEAD